jgi:pseudaminic acid synthase
MKSSTHKTFIVAELSANHNHDIEVAKQTIRAAKITGADAIKLQTYTADTLTIDSDQDHFLIKGGLWDGRSLYDLYSEAYTPWEWHEDLFTYARNLGIEIFSTPFDKTSVDFLEHLNVPIYKIASFEIQDIPLIEYVASKCKPMIMSTGIASYEDIVLALQTCRENGNDQLELLKCTSAYPAPLAEANLLTIPNMREVFNVSVGLSDHTMGANSAIAAVALGATTIEKHFILDRKLGGPDSSFSMEPVEFTAMVKSIREVEEALGGVCYNLSESSKENLVFKRSLFVVQDVKIGEKITHNNIRSIRPGYGLPPKYYNDFIGKQFSKDVKRGTPMDLTMVTK